jgi:hypothetical protein
MADRPSAAAFVGNGKAVAADGEILAMTRNWAALPVPMIRIAPSSPPCAPRLAICASVA